MSTAAPESSMTLPARVGLALRDIKLAHSVFALPFAVLAAFLTAPRGDGGLIRWGAFAGMLGLIVACMFFARTWAMLVNRVADARIDAANPRTENRAFAGGGLTLRDGGTLLAASALAFVACTGGFGFAFDNWWPTILSVPVLVWIGFYSFTKRFTWWCHVFLGGALAASPLAAAIATRGFEAFAIDGVWSDQGTTLLAIAGMVLCWVAGFDVIYALQDLDYDREAGLNSIPARFGWRGAILISRVLHTLALASLALAWWSSDQLSMVFGAGVIIVASTLVYEHVVLAKRGRAGIPMAFFTLNGVISCVIGLAGAI
ncbi:MAG: 4-hydroxybenzoate octaprenyltransferase, partial [Planctomycetota bacterium]